jgi:hypothetical protein
LILKAYYITSLVMIYSLSLRFTKYFPFLVKHFSVWDFLYLRPKNLIE